MNDDHETTDDQGYGQIGYQAYVAFTGGLNYRGEPCPPWADLPEKIRGAWGAAATSVRSEHEHRNAADYDLEVSHAELAQLVAGLDALQRQGGHDAEVAFPLRSRLRATLFPPEPEAEPAPELPSTPGEGGPTLDSASAATESPGDEPDPGSSTTEPSPATDAAADGEPAPELPGAPRLPTDIGRVPGQES